MIIGRSISLALLAGCVCSCMRTVRAWPPPLAPGTTVDVHFAVPTIVVFERGVAKDSVRGIRDLRGTVLAVHGDTLVLSAASAVSVNAGETNMRDRRATLALDQSTIVTLREMDGWKFAYALLAGSVLIYVAAVLSGS
jgi:hypothetical protein